MRSLVVSLGFPREKIDPFKANEFFKLASSIDAIEIIFSVSLRSSKRNSAFLVSVGGLKTLEAS